MKWEMVKLGDVIEKPVSGEWGDGEGATTVLRTTNFRNDGSLDLVNVVKRNIPEKKIREKALQPGDCIIEKSGGGPSQPVGRVVYFNGYDEVILCNNFTSAIRPKSNVFPKYLFWFLFNNHLTGNTLQYQNKTTGILNLKLERYISEVSIPLPPLATQRRIAEILDKADALRQKDRALLRKYDELAQAVFVDMFGDPVRNEKGWEVVKLGETILDIAAGDSYGGEEGTMSEESMGVLKVSAVTSGYFRPDQYKVVSKKAIEKEVITVKKGDMLFSRANTRELVGATCIVDNTYSNLFIPDKLWRIDFDNRIINNYFAKYVLSNA